MSYWLLAEGDVDDLRVNSWRWGATVPLIQKSGVLEPGVEIFGQRVVVVRQESCQKLADWLEENVLADLPQGARIKLDGEVTSEPDDHVFHRENLDQNYSVDREWLLEFVSFLRVSGGFNTMG
ncbi:MAG: hypothetical protein WD768_03590 [Phycisphaeraceae bacterium]